MISTLAILPAFVFAATEPKRLEKFEPSETIVILSWSSLPFESIPIVTTGATLVWPVISIPLNDTAGAEAYPNPGSTISILSKAPSSFVAVAVAVSPVKVWLVPDPKPVISITLPPLVAERDTLSPVDVLI